MEGSRKEPCPQCRENGGDTKGDNLVVYAPGRGSHCFACGYHVHGDGETVETAKTKLTKAIRGQVLPLNHRRIDERTTRFHDYRTAKVNGEKVEVANYLKDGELVAQHIRGKSKQFRWLGDVTDLPLYGQWLWSGKGKRIVITEGEIDCLSVSQLWQNRWPVVSLPNGVSHGPKAIKTNLTFLSGYDEVVLAFDNDDAGRMAAEKCAELLPAGKVRIAHLPLKDANECLLRNESKSCLQSIYEARTYQPDGILHVSDISEHDRPHQNIWSFPWDCMTRSFMGQRSGEMTLWASGTGSGKSTVIRELSLHHLLRGRRVGLLMLEEAPAETLDDLISLKISKPVRQIRAARELNTLLVLEGGDCLDFGYPDDLTDEEYEEARQFFSAMPLYIYDHHGTNDFGNVLQRVEYMATALECDVIFIDHVTAVVAGMDRNGSERESIDDIMKKLRSIVERTGVHIDLVSQLNRLDGKAAEEGGQISLKNLRGSGSLGSVPNSVIAIERDQQAEDAKARSIIKVRSLKGRFTGDTGVAGHLKFDKQTRRLTQVEWDDQGEDDNVGSTLEPEQELEADLAGLDLDSLPEEGVTPGTPAPHHADR
jgi:twinkle protein